MKARYDGNKYCTEEEAIEKLRIETGRKDWRLETDKGFWWVQVEGSEYDPFPKGSWRRIDVMLA